MIRQRLKPGQFTLKAAFIATAFVAAAAALVQFIRTTDEPMGQFKAALVVPILVCGAVGILRRRVGPWLLYGLTIDVVLLLFGLVMLVTLVWAKSPK